MDVNNEAIKESLRSQIRIMASQIQSGPRLQRIAQNITTELCWEEYVRYCKEHGKLPHGFTIDGDPNDHA